MHICNMCFKYYSSPKCLNCCHDHHQGKFQEYEESKQSVKMHQETTRRYEECLRFLCSLTESLDPNIAVSYPDEGRDRD